MWLSDPFCSLNQVWIKSEIWKKGAGVYSLNRVFHKMRFTKSSLGCTILNVCIAGEGFFYPKLFWTRPKICKSTIWGTQILIHSDRKKILFLNRQIKYYYISNKKCFDVSTLWAKTRKKNCDLAGQSIVYTPRSKINDV